MKTKLYKIIYILLVGFASCNNVTSDSSKQQEKEEIISKTKFAPYEILKTEPYETSNKAQVVSYAYLTSDSITKENLSGTLTQIYVTLQSYSRFKNYISPTVVVVYLYASKDKAINMQGSWIAMLSKTPSDTEPKISFDDLQVNALKGMIDNEKSDDEKKLDEINEYLKKRNTDLCFIYKTLYDLERSTIKKADIKYPEYGTKHLEYQTKLYDDEKKKLFYEYNINDTLSAYITVFGMSYCK